MKLRWKMKLRKIWNMANLMWTVIIMKSYVLVTCFLISMVLYYKINDQTMLLNKYVSSIEFLNKTPSASSVIEKDETIQLGNLESCPKTSPYLIGDFAFHHFNGKLKDIEKLHDEPWKPGGRFKPKTCKSDQKVAIIIAYRDRRKHLLDFLFHSLPMFKRQQLDFTVFVVEQAGKEVFNRGLLMNVGVLESLKIDNYTCFIFHDVDMYPIHDFNLYKCEDKPKHMAVALQKSHFQLLFEGYYGGVTALNKTHVEMTNGFSNSFFGWGGEDGNHRDRIYAARLKTVRYPVRFSRYATPGHARDKTNPTNPKRFQWMQNTKVRMTYDGLNSAVYKVIGITYLKLYTNITVVIDKTAVFKKINETKVSVEKAKEQENERKLKEQENERKLKEQENERKLKEQENERKVKEQQNERKVKEQERKMKLKEQERERKLKEQEKERKLKEKEKESKLKEQEKKGKLKEQEIKEQSKENEKAQEEET